MSKAREVALDPASRKRHYYLIKFVIINARNFYPFRQFIGRETKEILITFYKYM